MKEVITLICEVTFVYNYSRNFYDKRIAAEVSAECLGEEWKVSYPLLYMVQNNNNVMSSWFTMA